MFHLLGEFCCSGTIRSASQSGVRVERPRSIRGWMAPWVGQTLVVGTKCHHAPLNLTVPDQIVPNHVCTIPDQLWSSKCHQNPSNLKYPTIPDQTVPLVLRHCQTMGHHPCGGQMPGSPSKPLRNSTQSSHALLNHKAIGAWRLDYGTPAFLSLSSQTSQNTVLWNKYN